MKTQLKSLPFLNNKVTFMIYFIVTPLINILFLLLMAGQFDDTFSFNIAISSVLLSGALLSMQTMSSMFVMDHNLHIDREVVSKNPYSLKYWGDKYLAAILCGSSLIFFNFLILLIFGVPIGRIIEAILPGIFICLSGSLVGQACSIFSWQMADLYFFQNTLSALAIILAGVVVPIDKCPEWIRYFSFILPFARTISFSNNGDNFYLLLIDLIIDFFWLIIMLIVYKVQINRFLQNPKD